MSVLDVVPEEPSTGQAFDRLFEDVRDELRRRASALCRREHSPMFATGDLINDVYLRLRKNPKYSLAVAENGRLHFIWLASRAMRNVLIDAARKRKGAEFISVSAADGAQPVKVTPEQLIDLEAALTALEEKHARKAGVITMRFYGGASLDELSRFWDVGDATVSRDIQFALQFLHAHLHATDETQ